MTTYKPWQFKYFFHPQLMLYILSWAIFYTLQYYANILCHSRLIWNDEPNIIYHLKGKKVVNNVWGGYKEQDDDFKQLKCAQAICCLSVSHLHVIIWIGNMLTEICSNIVLHIRWGKNASCNVRYTSNILNVR